MPFRVSLLAGFVLALAVRLLWVLKVQAPSETIYSDMAGYIFRARQMFTGEPDLHDSYPSCMPFGAHYFYAFEMLLLGMSRFGAMAIVQAFCGALVTPFAMLTARETFRAPLVVPAVGLLVALWHPQLVFVGYFSSEIPFAALLMASLWLTARFVRNGEGPFLAGLVTAFAFTVRPQILLTFLLSLVWLVVRRERLLWLSSKKFAALLLPMVLVVSFSSIRNRLLTGEWRLISANSAVGRFFADTDYRRIVARQPGPDGRDRQIGYFPPARTRYRGDFEFAGWRCDETVLEPARRAFVASKGRLYRAYLVRRNVLTLAVGNQLWPESGEVGPPTRRRAALLRYGSRAIAFVLVPLSFLGLVSLVRVYNPGLELAALHVATMVYSAAMYFGELRYRVPYDPILLLLAAQGILLLRGRAEGEPQDRFVSAVIGVSLALFAVVLIVPWPATG